MSELNKIFDVKSREARRKILDNYPISANDKNEILNKIGNSGEGGGNSNVEDNAEYYRIDWDKAIELGFDESSHNEVTIAMEAIINMVQMTKITLFGKVAIVPCGYALSVTGLRNFKYIKFLPVSLYIEDEDTSNFKSFNDVLQSMNADATDCFIPCTKEEFYSIN